MTRCKACGKEFRKGVLAFLLTPGGFKGARVCQSCASGGVLLVAPKLGPVIRKKEVRGDAVERVIRQLRALSTGANLCGSDDFHEGRRHAFEGAIEVIKRECGS